MAARTGTSSLTALEILVLSHSSDVSVARRAAKHKSTTLGFEERASEEIALVVSELATNLIKHAKCGTLRLARVEDARWAGIQIESEDHGPGIADVEQALTDGFSTSGSLGYGLGSVNRLMDELAITSAAGVGTRIVCKRWLRQNLSNSRPCPLDFGAASRACPLMAVNGDTFVIKLWDESGLIGVIDGLGHGQFAHRAAQAARQYVESHYDQPLQDIFLGAARVCRTTRGVVMGLARLDWGREQLTFASVGNVEARVFGSAEPINFAFPRGIVGLNTRHPVVTRHRWEPRNILVLHSDGLTTRWRWADFPHLAAAPATVAARELLRALARDADDATVVVVKGAASTGEEPGNASGVSCCNGAPAVGL